MQHFGIIELVTLRRVNLMDIINLGIANYRSFDPEGVMIENLKKINIFIGKNNSGKSNILRFLKLLADNMGNWGQLPNIIENQFRRNGKTPEITVTIKAKNSSSESIIKAFGQEELVTLRYNLVNSKFINNPFQPLNDHIIFNLGYEKTREEIEKVAIKYLKSSDLLSTLNCLNNLIYIPQFREIKQQANEQASNSTIINGENIINEIFKLKTRTLVRKKIHLRNSKTS
jgi:predicted ATPase